MNHIKTLSKRSARSSAHSSKPTADNHVSHNERTLHSHSHLQDSKRHHKSSKQSSLGRVQFWKSSQASKRPLTPQEARRRYDLIYGHLTKYKKEMDELKNNNDLSDEDKLSKAHATWDAASQLMRRRTNHALIVDPLVCNGESFDKIQKLFQGLKNSYHGF